MGLASRMHRTMSGRGRPRLLWRSARRLGTVGAGCAEGGGHYLGMVAKLHGETVAVSWDDGTESRVFAEEVHAVLQPDTEASTLARAARAVVEAADAAAAAAAAAATEAETQIDATAVAVAAVVAATGSMVE